MDHRLPHAVSWPLFCALLVACSAENASGGGGAGGQAGPTAGGGTPTGGSGAGIPAGCSALATAECDAIEACAPILIDIYSGSLALCVARRELGCHAEILAADSGYRETDAASCAAAYEAGSCDGMVAAVAQACAAAEGTRTDGNACATNSQCASSYCRLDAAATNGCGSCAPRIDAGAACDTDPSACAAGTSCAAAICQPLAGSGSSCAAGEPCDLGLVCQGGLCTKGKNVGEACDDATLCDGGQALSCTASVCTAPALAAPGAVCVPPEGMPAPICTASSVCAANGVCRPPAEDGTPCGGAPGVGCYGPARCADGACKLVDALSCDEP
jgi:hypothetical protein